MKNNIFEFIYRNAMSDATLQKAYNGEKTILTSEKTDKVRNILIEHINKIIDGNYKNTDKNAGKKNYDKDFYILADAISQEINENFPSNNFTFGNSQKLINITIKYFYILSYKDRKLKKNFEFCHCPMDRIMISKVVQDYSSAISNKPADRIFKKFNKEMYSWSNVSWSHILNEDPSENIEFGIDVYEKYQDMVRALAKKGKSIPIEYDYIHFYESTADNKQA